MGIYSCLAVSESTINMDGERGSDLVTLLIKSSDTVDKAFCDLAHTEIYFKLSDCIYLSLFKVSTHVYMRLLIIAAQQLVCVRPTSKAGCLRDALDYLEEHLNAVVG